MKVTFAKCYVGNVERIHGPFPTQHAAAAYVLEHHQSLRWDFYYVTQDVDAPPKLHDFECKACAAVTEAWDMPSACAVCGHAELEKMLPMPSLYGLEGSASFLDGTRRKGFAEMKEASQLETQMLDTHPAKRESIKQEISKLKGTET